MRGIRFIDNLFQDLQYGLWTLRRNPGFTFVAALMLSVGIGANTAIFSVVNAMLLRPLPYYDPHRLVSISEFRKGEEYCADSDYLYWQSESNSFDHLVLFTSGQVFMTGRGEPERLDSIRATVDLFPALGVAPQLGRAFAQEDDRPGSDPVAILSHAFWQRRFGGDPSIIGQSLTFDGRSRQVIGVMPPNFMFIRKADVLMPRALDVQETLANQQSMLKMGGYIIGRLKPGVSVEHARSDLDSIMRRVGQANPAFRAERVIVTLLGEKLFGRLRPGLLALFGAAAFILLITCANLANLLLARASVRQKEMAIRAAMGAGRGRLIRQLLTESLLLSVLGGVAGILLALLGVKALVPLIPDNLAHLNKSGIDGAALGFTLLASLLTGAIAGIVPALRVSRIDLNVSLKEGVRGAVFSKRKRARSISPALVIGELALTLALLAGAALLIKSFLRLRAVDPGYNPENLLTMAIPRYTAGYSLNRKAIFFRDLLTRINSLPGVKVAAIGPIPLASKGDGSSLPTPISVDSIQCCYEVSPDYFRALDMPLRAGRGFTEQDNESAAPVIVINETMARRFFTGVDPIGKSMVYDEKRDGTVVGVVADVKRFGLEIGWQNAEIYHSVLQRSRRGDIILLIRTAGDPVQLAPAVRRQIWEIDSKIPIVDVKSMERRLGESVAPRRFQMLLFSLFAVLALVTAVVGIYGFISYAVSQRAQEIGIRMALGAQANDVLRMVVWRAMLMTLIGVALGLAMAFALTRVMKNLFFNVSATDPTIFSLTVLILVGVTLIASYFPARRATKVDPLLALRHE